MTYPLLRDMGNIANIKACQPLHFFPCWTTPVDDISSACLAATHQWMSCKLGADVADDCMNALTAEATKEYFLGDLDNYDLASWLPPVRPMNPARFQEILSHLSFMRAAAVLYALDNILGMHEIVWVFWRDVKKPLLSPFSQKLLAFIPVHLFYPFVFWVDVDGRRMLGTVADLPMRLGKLSGLSWGRFAESVRMGNIDLEKAARQRFGSF